MFWVQLGLPADKSQYIHRVGRTARAGKRGRSALLLSDFEAPYFLRQLRDVTVTPAPPLSEQAAYALQVAAADSHCLRRHQQPITASESVNGA